MRQLRHNAASLDKKSSAIPKTHAILSKEAEPDGQNSEIRHTLPIWPILNRCQRITALSPSVFSKVNRRFIRRICHHHQDFRRTYDIDSARNSNRPLRKNIGLSITAEYSK